MLHSGRADKEEGSSQDKGVRNVTVQNLPQGQIQKISQEGSKNTYVIIVNKDCIKSENVKGPPVIRQTPVLKRNHAALANHPILQACSDQNKSYPETSDDSTVSPNNYISSSRVKNKPHHRPEDVKLNLSTINDDEYDSNFSAKNVFLKPDSCGNDSAIDVDFVDSQCISENNQTRSFYCEKNKMNTYVIPSPLGSFQQQKKGTKQHTFPMISPNCYGGQRYPKPELFSENASTSSTARKIFLVTPTSSSSNGGSVLQKSVAYTNEAVPVLGKGKITSLHQSKANPKAVPTIQNVSPISNISSSFIPITSAVSPFVDSNGQGPLTSTPITGEPVNARLHQLRQESATHRPVYVIPSPFTKNASSSEAFSSFMDTTDSHCESPAPVFVVPPLSTSTLNNSSGFISASSSLELADNSCSFDNTSHVGMDKNDKCNVELITGTQLVSQSSVTVSGDGLGRYVISSSSPDRKPDKDLGLGNDSENDPSLTSSQDSEASDVSEKVGLNRSLTNIQWLKGMQLKEDKPSSPMPPQQPLQWKNLTPEEIKKISADCGRESRPPFSYMSMIQMALYSREDRKMMLKEICKWIEETFPYYKFTAKPGWKNSIRHNLSLYNIFEREPAKRHGSYWTIKPDTEPRTKQYKERNSGTSSNSQSETHQSTPSLPSQTQGGVIPIIPMYSSMGQLSALTPQPVCLPNHHSTTITNKKKGPPPILPRPSPYTAPQAYALIPISGVGSMNMSGQTGQPQVIVNLSNPGSQGSSACPSPGISEMSAAVASIQMSCSSPIPQDQIESNINKEHIYTKKPHLNIVKQAWLDSQSMDTASSVDSDIVSSNDIASSSELSGNRTKSKRPRDKPSLPKPVMYKQGETKPKLTGSKRRKLQQKERTLLNESSDEEDDGTKFISNLEKEIDLLTTSTPMKTDSPTVSQLPSPIRGLTPLRNNSLFELDGSFLDSLVDKKELGLSPESSVIKKTLEEGSPPFSNTHNMSFLDLNDLGFTSPDKMDSPDNNTSLGHQNISKILLDYGLDAQQLDNPESLPNLNWSIMQQMVDGMDVPDKASF